MAKLVYFLPVHNEQTVLAANVARLREHLARFEGSEIFLLENGSRDTSWTIAQELAKQPITTAFKEDRAGIGYAYHRGFVEALERHGPSTTTWAILTAADLPFGFSDLDAAIPHLERGSSRILMGSKAHPESVVGRGAQRWAMSQAYRLARRAMLGMRVGDSQGSVFVRLDLAAEITPKIESRGFFYSTELCHAAERAGETIVELPVVLEKSNRASTVRPVKHGTEMLRQMWELRRRG
jgi:dolichyl-phosphate beta-glucosyltransferase